MTETASPTDDTALASTAASRVDAPPSGDLAPADLARGTVVGRYVVLAKLGAGGMGVVFAAYDPELDRKVALKLLHPRWVDADPFATSEARTRLVREAQALAKLNHPHIVAVHDVGEHDGAVWLAMEYVEGETLSAWLKQRRTWREVLDVLTPAVRGLSAAHKAGLVHRDIKPDNLMLGADGRVRVMDLGLVRALGNDGLAPEAPEAPTAAGRDLAALAAQVTRAGSVMGTPAYMSPEQFRGETVDARTDVFSLCVTLWEALMAERPFAGATPIELAMNVLAERMRPVPRDAHSRRVPGWLRRVCLQGLSADPGRRFASMQALLDALSQGRARARARKWLMGVAAVAALGAFAALYQRHDRAERVAACEAEGAGIFAVWNDEARAGVRDGIIATGVSYAPETAEKVMPFLDAQAEAWREHRTRACLAAVIEETFSAEDLDRAAWCLDERRMELAALATKLTRADAKVVQRAVTAAAGLPPVSPCIDVHVLAALPSPPPVEARARTNEVRASLSQARTLLSAGKFPDGLKQVRSTLANAEALGWPPLIAAARKLEGDLLERTGAFEEAEAASLAAYMEAAKVRAWDVAAGAAVDLEYNIGYRQARHAEGKVWAGHAEVALVLAGDPLNLGEAGRLNNLALVHESAGAYSEAKALNERALANLEKALGPDHPRVAGLLNNLANVHDAMGAYAEAKVLHERVLAIRENALGPEHPNVAQSLNNLANVHYDTGSYAEAKVLHERALAIREKALGPEHPDVATSLNNLANVHNATGANAEAKVLHERALAIREALGPEHPDVASTLHNLANVHYATGSYAEAKVLHERAMAIREKALGPEHPLLASSLNCLANVHYATGANAEAKEMHERALAIREKALGPEHPDVAYSLGNLANVHRAMGSYAEAKVLHERALAIREKALGPEHPNVAASLNNLAVIHEATGAYAEAKALHERALAIREKALSPVHPDVAQSLNNLANVQEATGAYAEAKEMHERALAIREKALGAEHPDVAVSLNNLANVHYDTGSYAEAKVLHERALGLREKALGPEHADVALTLNNLANVHTATGAHAEAKEMHERALAIREKALGPVHSDVAQSLNNLADIHKATGSYAEAKVLYERALAIREKALGPEHPLLADSLSSLGNLALVQRQPTAARRLLERAVTIYDAHEGMQPLESETHFSLARALRLTKGDRTRAFSEARRAADGFRAAGKAKELAEVEAFLAKHRGAP
ncbi:serine/threonine-protein kinase [Nannocystis radixulma]|uniref:Serine/threonine-protein kinase n=1 Tax=Nannocystis radixulma TaxID=2995305 RepID=A0ABT5BJV9_9BACT|nr:serine/threonine-protein kinase [Nannocystis radixulma]MDC0674439.1 serine/threonine-protein kinase [Nannocystis radixulma]